MKKLTVTFGDTTEQKIDSVFTIVKGTLDDGDSYILFTELPSSFDPIVFHTLDSALSFIINSYSPEF